MISFFLPARSFQRARRIQMSLSPVVTVTLVVAVTGLPSRLPAQQNVTVEGNRDVLRAAVTALMANSASFNKGRARFRMTIDSAESDGMQRDVAEGTAEWNGNKVAINAIRTIGKGPKAFATEMRMIESGDSRSIYFPSGPLLVQKRGPRETAFKYFRVTPADAWFQQDWTSRWSALLNPEEPSIGDKRITFTVEEQGEHRIIVRRRVENKKHRVVIEVDFARGGNVVKYWTDGPIETGFAREGELEWLQNADGRWILKSLRNKRDFWENGKVSPQEVDLLEIWDFEPAPKFEDGHFTEAWLGVASRTRVEEYGPDGGMVREYYRGSTGQAEGAVDQERLSELARILRSTGFAAPRD